MKKYFTTPSQNTTKFSSKIVIIYLIISILWIFFSDSLLSNLNLPNSMQTTVSIFKGWFFVVISALMLFYLLKRFEQQEKAKVVLLEEEMTERKKSQEQLLKWEQIFQHSGWGVVITDPMKNTLLAVNPACAKMYGYAVTEVTGKNLLEFFAPEYKAELPKHIEVVHREGHHSYESVHVRKDGSRFPVLITVTAFKDEKGNLLYRAANIIDITERKQAEEEIKTKSEELQTLNKIIHKTIEAVDLNTRLEYIMDEALNVVGLEGGTICLINPDNTFDLAVHRETSEETINDLSLHKIKIGECLCGNCAKDCKPLILNTREEVLEFATREVLRGEDIRFHAAFPFIVGKKCVGVLCVFTRTDNKPIAGSLKLLETIVAQTAVAIDNASLYENMKESEEKFSTIFKAAPGSMILSSLPDGKTIEINNNFSLITGYSREEAIGKTTGDLNMWVDPSERDRFLSMLQTDGVVQYFEADLNHKSGTIRNGLLSGHILTIQGKKYLISTFYDITERKKAEEEILKLSRVYAVISQINQAIVHLREKDKLLSEVCRVAIEFGKFQMAWIGLVDEETKLVNPITFAGIEDGYLTKIKKISISDIPEGRGPTGTAIREGKHFVCNDIETDPCMVEWKDEALKRGYRSSIALPIKLFGKVIGAFSLYAPTPHFFDQEEIVLLDEVTNDISFALEAIEVAEKHKEAEQTMLDSEKRYRELFMSHPHPMWIYEVDTLKIIEVNESAIKNYGYSNDEFTSLTLKDIRPEEDVFLLLNNVKTHNESIQRDRTFKHKKKDGTIIQVEISSHNLPSQKYTNCRIVMAIDITEQYKAEETLHESEERFRTAFEYSASGMCLTALDGNFLQVNKALCQMLGYSEDELLNITFAKITHPDDISLSKSFVDRAVEEGTETLHFEKRYLRKDGDVIWAEVSSSLLRDANKKPLYFITQIIDTSQRKRAEETIQRNEAVLRLFVEHSPAAIAMFDREMRYIVASHRFLTDYNLGEQNVIGRSHYEIFLEIPERWKEIHSRCLSGAIEKCEEDQFPRADGKIDWVRWEIRPWYEHSNEIGGIILFSEIITERKRAEEKLLASEARYRLLFESAKDGILILDADTGMIVDVNPFLIELLGYSQKEFLLKKIWDVGLFKDIIANKDNFSLSTD